MSFIRTEQFALVVSLLVASVTSASDWPAFRRDERRSSVSPDRLQFPMRMVWRYESRLEPRPAFPDPLKHPAKIDFAVVRDNSEPVLLDFDHAFHPVAAGGRVFFGSSADDAVRCLSLETGQDEWSFVTGGPVRFAPQVVGDRVYVASDDGFVYCLNAETSEPLWSAHVAPNHRQLAGNGRMISRWPARSGVLVLDGVVYVTAGMWPAEGIFVYALDAETGETLWINDTSGTLNQRTSNPGAYAISGVAPTGYLLASDKALVVPTGRSMPATYSRVDGRLLASTAPSYQNRRGGPAVCIDRHNSVLFGSPRERLTTRDYGLHYAYQLPAMTQFGIMRADRILSADRTFVAVNDLIRCYDANSRYTKVKVEWEQPCPSRTLRCLSLSANALLMGVDERVTARDRSTGDLLWESPALDGYVHSIAVVDEQLLVATDTGSIYCLGSSESRADFWPNTSVETPGEFRYDTLPAALKENRIRQGLALVIGTPATKLASEIAAASELNVVLLLDDPAMVGRTRNELLNKHVPGCGQVSVQSHASDAALPFADFAFNLIVATGDVATARASELFRVLRPAGGELHVAGADAETTRQIEHVLRRAAGDDLPVVDKATSPFRTGLVALSTTRALEVVRTKSSVIFRRGKLPGALDWDSETSVDQRVKWPLELLWFGGPGSKRTGGGSRAPIAAGGRNFVVGKNHLIALDAYNGTELWSRTLPYLYRIIGRLRNAPGPIRPWLTESINADDDHVWLNFGQVVYTLDAATGEQVAVHGGFPDAPVLTLDQKELVLPLDHYQQPGPRGVTSETTKAKTTAGRIRIQIDGSQTLKLALELNGASVVDERLYWDLFLDVRPMAQRANLYSPGVFHLIVRPASGLLEAGVGDVHPEVSIEVEDEGRRVVLAVPLTELQKLRGGPVSDLCFAAALNHPATPDQETMAGGRGYLRWELHADAFATAFNNGWPRIVIPRFRPDKTTDVSNKATPLPTVAELPDIALKGGRVGRIGQRAGSLVKLNGQRANPLSQETSDFNFNRGKGCGYLVSSAGLQVLRSGTLAFYDTQDDSGMRYFGGVRPACTISAIPAQGLVFAAEGSSGCSCNYNFKTTLALAPAKKRRNEDWAMFTAPLSPGAQLQTGRFNLGAPGDRRDDAGNLWLQYPRAPTYSSRILPTAIRTTPVPVKLSGNALKTYRVNADRVEIAGTDRPWLFASGYEGINDVQLQLFMTDEEGVVVFPGEAPKLDAELEPDAWERRYSAPAGTGSSMFLSHDDTALFVGYEVVPPLDRRGKRLPWTTREGDSLPFSGTVQSGSEHEDTLVWEETSIEFLIADRSLQTILHLGVGVTGGRYDAVWSTKANKEDASVSPNWSGAWNVTGDNAIAEFSIPWETLKSAGLDADNLVIRPRTRGPLKRQPHISHGFRPVIVKSSRPKTKRYQVTLHFAELQDVQPGDRVFDIQLQGQTVVAAFDPVTIAGGRNRSVSQTFHNVEADRVLDIHFAQQNGTEGLPPILSAVEAVLEE